MSEHKPPLRFWREVSRLDDQLDDLSQPAGKGQVGSVVASRRRTVWTYGDTNTPTRVLWEGYSGRFLGRVASQLYVSELVQSDISSDLGVFGDVYRYSPRLFMRILKKGTYMVPLLSYEENPPVPLTSDANDMASLESIFGSQASLTADDYDRFIVELRRGASGEHQSDLPPTLRGSL